MSAKGAPCRSSCKAARASFALTSRREDIHSPERHRSAPLAKSTLARKVANKSRTGYGCLLPPACFAATHCPMSEYWQTIAELLTAEEPCCLDVTPQCLCHKVMALYGAENGAERTDGMQQACGQEQVPLMVNKVRVTCWHVTTAHAQGPTHFNHSENCPA